MREVTLLDAANYLSARDRQVPALRERRALKHGDYAKIIFRVRGTSLGGEPRGEGIWVKVTKREPDGSYRGVIGREPTFAAIHRGDEVLFRSQHIAEVDRRHTPLKRPRRT